MKRILEPEVMGNLEEALAYDSITLALGGLMVNREAAFIIKRMPKSADNYRILNIGCGPARLDIALSKMRPGYKFYGIDLSQAMLEIAAKNIKAVRKGQEDAISLIRADGKRLPFKNNSFNLVICTNTLHHFKDPTYVLREIKRVVKAQGTIIIGDMIRPASRFLVSLLVRTIGLAHTLLMKKGDRDLMLKEYRDSLYAAFTINEHKEMLAATGLTGCQIIPIFPSFVAIVWRAQI